MNLSAIDYESHQQRLHSLSKIVFEYLLIISLDKITSSEIFELKKYLRIKYGCEHAASAIPHITLINFIQLENNEERILKYLKRFSESINPFEIQLNGFGQFPPHTIYVNVLTKTPIVEIVKDMQTKFRKILQLTERDKPIFIKTPHVTIARKMTASQHDKAWQEFKEEKYMSTFQTSEMSLLRRAVSGGRYETIATFPFTGNVFSGEQLRLPF